MPARYVTDLFDALHAHGAATALVAAGRSWSFAELRADTYRTARALRGLGVGRGDGLVLLAANTPDALLVRLAAYLLGSRFTHVHLGPTTHEGPLTDGAGIEDQVTDGAESVTDGAGIEGPLTDGAGIEDQVTDGAESVTDGAGIEGPVTDGAGIDSLLTDGPVISGARIGGVARGGDVPVGAGAFGVRAVTVERLAGLAAGESDEPLPVAAAEDDIARITYTGGTTGLPKGVPTTYAALHAAARSALAGAAAARDELAARTGSARFLAVTPIAHVAGDMALMMLMLGITVETYDFEPGAMLASLAALRGGAVLTYLYPALLGQLLDHPDRRRTDTSALSFVVYGSAPIAPARLRAAIDAFGPVFQQGYASTEAPAITALTVADHVRGLNDRPELLASAGRVLPGVEVTIRDAAGAVLPAGEIAEVCVRSDSVMPGYWRRPAETAAVLRDGWLHTGDLGRFDDDGYLYLVGRAREMIIVGGWNCYAAPIEAALTEHPLVRAASVVGAPDGTTGEAVVAYLIADAPVPADELRAVVTARLPEINVPSRVEYLDALPLTPLGKPDKNALRARSH
ncbi:AMP-binding protein [Actinocatenispora sera]|uniref:AMP-binding protein n=1 Tax=Actinocatenispora sera TaxID=390989 RepID=UPI00068E5CDA|nr:AMP-binding protein [Actinocatenispora sera]